MKAVWVIGNGFDVNLGLHTSYADFYDRHYGLLASSEMVADREKLETIAPRSERSPLWSDLECLLGEASSSFGSFDEFYDLFHRMQTEIELYVARQDDRFRGDAEDQAFYLEFLESLFHPTDRLDHVDKKCAEGRMSGSVSDACSIINLNYTASIEKILNGIKAYLSKNRAGDNLETGINDLVHPHGSLEFPRQIVFGVGDAAQIANTSFRQDEECLSCWTKLGRDAVYGNGRISQALNLISRADLILIFGCSFGRTDGHLWRAIGNRLEEEPGCNVVVFDHNLPEKGDDLRLYMRKADEARSSVCDAFGVSSGKEPARSRVVLCNSGRVFRFSGEAVPKLGLDPLEIAERKELLSKMGHPVGSVV